MTKTRARRRMLRIGGAALLLVTLGGCVVYPAGYGNGYARPAYPAYGYAQPAYGYYAAPPVGVVVGGGYGYGWRHWR
jgi:hypothetical protein